MYKVGIATKQCTCLALERIKWHSILIQIFEWIILYQCSFIAVLIFEQCIWKQCFTKIYYKNFTGGGGLLSEQNVTSISTAKQHLCVPVWRTGKARGNNRHVRQSNVSKLATHRQLALQCYYSVPCTTHTYI